MNTAEWVDVNPDVFGDIVDDPAVRAFLLSQAQIGEEAARAAAPVGGPSNPAPTLRAGHFSDADGDDAIFGVRPEIRGGHNVPALIYFGTSSFDGRPWLDEGADAVRACSG